MMAPTILRADPILFDELAATAAKRAEPIFIVNGWEWAGILRVPSVVELEAAIRRMLDDLVASPDADNISGGHLRVTRDMVLEDEIDEVVEERFSVQVEVAECYPDPEMGVL